jgi:hypothetical protein
MSSSDLIRWGGLAAMLAGMVWIVAGLLGRVVANPETNSWVNILFIVAVLLVLVGLVGFHTLQKGNYGRIGRAGFYTVVVATFAQVLALVVFLAGSDALFWLQFPVGGLAVLVGFVLYGAATLQAKVLPRWCGIAFIIAVPVSVALGGAFGSPGIDYVWLGLVWLALGYVLWSWRGTAAEQPSRVS